jgi:hypothetical protein
MRVAVGIRKQIILDGARSRIDHAYPVGITPLRKPHIAKVIDLRLLRPARTLVGA